MESYLKISYLNDWVFCPLSIYYHQLYGDMYNRMYYDDSQINGKAAHSAIDEQRYSTHKNILQGIDVYCEKYMLCGKIDIFDIDKSQLTERKKKIVNVYDGYVFQLYGQYFSLCEMGYNVGLLRLYSSDDNKVYNILRPEDDEVMFNKFENVIKSIAGFNVDAFQPTNKLKCENCIYRFFCDRTLADNEG